VYHRAEVVGLDRIPTEPTMLVGNHDGGYIPVDGICLGVAWHERFAFARPLRVLMHDFPFRLSPKLTRFLSQCGCLPASRASLNLAFDAKHDLFVYPGGAYEAFRPWTRRREIDLGHRTGFIGEALKRRVPITPVVSIGAHETLFVVMRGGWLAKRIPLARMMRSDVVPLWLGLPWGIGFGPMPHIPLPSKIKLEVLPAIRLWQELGEAADPSDPAVLNAGLALVRRRMQAVSDRLYSERRFPLIG
jgi:1-acyl-sn-glycerol-3-phosphate acyltransferase